MNSTNYEVPHCGAFSTPHSHSSWAPKGKQFNFVPLQQSDGQCLIADCLSHVHVHYDLTASMGMTCYTMSHPTAVDFLDRDYTYKSAAIQTTTRYDSTDHRKFQKFLPRGGRFD